MRRAITSRVAVLVVCQATAGLAGDLPPLIPRAVLLGNPDRAHPKISPDGTRLAYLAPDEGVLNVWARTLGKDDDRAVTTDRNRGIRWFTWAPNNRQIIYGQDKDGDERQHLYAVDLTANEARDLTPFEGVQARLVAMEPKVDNEILVAINQRNPEMPDIFRIDLTSGKATLEIENHEGLIEWTADANLQVRAAVKLTPDGGYELMLRENTGSAWRTLTTVTPEDTLYTGPVGFTHDGQGLYLLSSTGSNTSELREVDLATGTQKTLASDRQADVAEVLMNPVTHSIQAVSFYKERIHWKVLDKTIKRDFKAIRRIQRGDFFIRDGDYADRTWLIAFTTDNGPVSYYSYDRDTKNAELLFTNRRGLEGVTLAKMAPVGFLARDGLVINGYLTVPPGMPAKQLPTVVLIHRGSWQRDRWGYNGVVQWLANRGYAVLQINFRGSGGYGKAFMNAATREWGGKMQDDLVDGVKWAIARGFADPQRIAIFGYSYGGYAALMGLALTPDVFCCGVDISGPNNLITFVKNFPPYLKPLEPLIFDRIGHPEKDAEFLTSRSPLFLVDRITQPLLIYQGGNDPHTKQAETSQLVDALKKAGRQVAYEVYPDEGHYPSRPENRLDFYGKAEKFLAKHLGGRYEE